MFRKDKEITDKAEIEDILLKARICRLAMADERVPYLVPLCFAYHEGAIYVHTARQGKKLDIVSRNPNVCFEVETDVEIVPHQKACKWDVKFKSVIGQGRASIIRDNKEKLEALDLLLDRFAGTPGEYGEKAVDSTTIIKVEITSLTGKKAV